VLLKAEGRPVAVAEGAVLAQEHSALWFIHRSNLFSEPFSSASSFSMNLCWLRKRLRKQIRAFFFGFFFQYEFMLAFLFLFMAVLDYVLSSFDFQAQGTKLPPLFHCHLVML